MTNQLVLTITKLSSGKKILLLSIFFLLPKKSALVLEKILVFVLLEHELKSKFSCKRGEEERLIEERRREEK